MKNNLLGAMLLLLVNFNSFPGGKASPHFNQIHVVEMSVDLKDKWLAQDFAGVVSLGEKIAGILEQEGEAGGLYRALYVPVMQCVAGAEFYMGNYAKALEAALKAYETAKENRDECYVELCFDIANFNACLSDYASAVEFSIEGLEAYSTSFGEDSIYAGHLNDLSYYYASLGNYREAIAVVENAIEISKENNGSVDGYIEMLNSMAAFYSAAGSVWKAVEIGEKVADTILTNYGKNDSYANSLNNLALYYANAGDYEKSIELCETSVGLLRSESNLYYAVSVSTLSSLYAYVGRYSDAIKMSDISSKIYIALYGKRHPFYAKSINMEASYYALSGDYSTAKRLMEEVLGIYESLFGKSDIYYASALQEYSNYCIMSSDFSEAGKTAMGAASITNGIVLDRFNNLTSIERRDFWNGCRGWYEEILPFVAYKVRSDSLICSMYDGALLSKGILLNSEMEMRDLLLESGDTAVVSLYEQMRINRSMAYRQREDLAGLAAMDDSVRMAVRQRADSLERVADRQERELVERSKVFGDYMRNLSISWRDVQKMLGKDEIAIEFLEVPVADDSVVYAALTLKYDYDCPHFIELFDGRMLTELDKSLYFSSPALYDMVWKPIEKEMENVRAVYFSPAGELHRIAVEYAPVADGEFICDRYDLYRLSSTRQLVAYTGIAETVRDGNTAVLYGGLDYDAAPSDIVADGNRHAGKSGRGIHDFYPAIPADSLIARGPVASLPATRLEVDSINRIMENSHWDVRTFTGSLGTEASFKALSGQLKSVIHVATHGFYGKDDRENIIMPGIFSYGNRYVEDKAMARSGLLFAGAANAWQMPDTVDNGILTAQEVSALDLRGLDLCVLSACETGLGEISGDGVFGLQRGFKKAGAKTLLISLNRVYDEATGLLMTEFYRNYLSGMSKVESLKSAQQYLRDYERTVTNSAANAAVFISKSRQQAMGRKKVKPFTDPVYWAQFILVDAL